MNQIMVYGVKAELDCHATVHGKAPSDGVGAMFKKEAASYTLLCKPKEAILTAERLYERSKT